MARMWSYSVYLLNHPYSIKPTMRIDYDTCLFARFFTPYL